MGKSIGKNLSKDLIVKYGPSMLAMHQKLLDHAKNLATNAIKNSSKRAIQNTAEATGDLICNKIADKNRKLSKKFEQKR